MTTGNIFCSPSATPEQIEEFLVKGTHKLKWTGKDKFKKPIVCRAELKITFLRQVMKAVSQVMLLKGMDPTIISVFYDLIDLEKKMVKRTKIISNLKQKQKMSV